MKIPIVVVDDDDADRYLVKRAVRALEYESNYVEFEAGDSFVESISDEKTRCETMGSPPPPILVLLDINMPRMSGFEVLDQLQELFADGDPNQLIIVTMYTSSNHAEDRRDALKYSFVRDYIVKPITADKLKNVVEKHCLSAN